MGKLIDVEKFKKDLLENYAFSGFQDLLKDFCYALDSQPPVDAVPVRCKDCKFFSHGYCRFHDAKFVRPDGYCYWGEQKEGEQHD